MNERNCFPLAKFIWLVINKKPKSSMYTQKMKSYKKRLKNFRS